MRLVVVTEVGWEARWREQWPIDGDASLGDGT